MPIYILMAPGLPKAQVSDLEHLQLAIAAAGVTLWTWNVDSDELAMDDQAFDLRGVPRSAHVIFEDLSAHIHPADRERVRAAFAATPVRSAAIADSTVCSRMPFTA